MKIYEKMNDSALRPILMDIVNEAESQELDIFDPSIIDSNFSDIMDIVDGEIETYIGDSSYAGHSAFEDSTFFISILLMNKNFMTEPIKRPKRKVYKVNHTITMNQTVYETYENTYDTFLPLTKDILLNLQVSGDYTALEGDMVNSYIEDSEIIDDEIDSIEEL
jgi:hypothetical protein